MEKLISTYVGSYYLESFQVFFLIVLIEKSIQISSWHLSAKLLSAYYNSDTIREVLLHLLPYTPSGPFYKK